jgi:hypothetical protein
VTTPLDIINFALKDAGVTGSGITPNAEETNDAFTRINWMLAQWQRKRWLVWHLVDLVCSATGANSYSIGPGQQFDVVKRPAKLESAFLRQTTDVGPSNVDYPLEIINAYEDWAMVALKTLVSFPSYVFYDTGFPIGTLYFWPVPQAGLYEMHIQVVEQLTQFTTLVQDINLPEEYIAAIHYNLAVRLAPAYGQQVNPAVVALARDSLNVIRMANVQIGRLHMPGDLIRPGIYNPYSDQVR